MDKFLGGLAIGIVLTAFVVAIVPNIPLDQLDLGAQREYVIGYEDKGRVHIVQTFWVPTASTDNRVLIMRHNRAPLLLEREQIVFFVTVNKDQKPKERI